MKTQKRILLLTLPLLTLLLSVIMVMSISVMPIAYAESEIEEPTAEETISDWAEYWNSDLQPKLELLVTTILGVVLGLISMILLVKRLIDKVKTAVHTLSDKEVDTITKTEELKSALNDINTVRAELETYKGELIKAKDTIVQLYSSVSTDMSKIKTVLEIGFGNTKELVVSGVAKEISKELGNEQER